MSSIHVSERRWFFFLSHDITFALLLTAMLFQACNSPGIKPDKGAADSLNKTATDELAELNAELLKDSLNPGLYARRSRLYVDREEYNQALSDAGKAIQMDSLNSDYYILLADIYTGLKNFNNSFAALGRAIETDPGNERAYLKSAELHLVFRNFGEAIRDIDKVMGINELNANAIFLRGVVFLETGDTALAVRNFQRAIEISPDYLEPNMQLGILYSLRKNKLAIEYFNNVLNIDPSSIEAKYSIAMFYQETGLYAEAMAVYESMLLENPSFVYARYNLGYIELVYLKNYEKAISHFEKAVEIHPDYPDAFYNMGFCYELLGDIQKSLDNYRKAIGLEPNHKKAVEGLNRMDRMLDGR